MKKTTLSTLTTFSPELEKQLEQSVHTIAVSTEIVNKKIRDFRNRSHPLLPEVEELATIVSVQMQVMGEKFDVLYELITDLYSKWQTLQEEKNRDV